VTHDPRRPDETAEEYGRRIAADIIARTSGHDVGGECPGCGAWQCRCDEVYEAGRERAWDRE